MVQPKLRFKHEDGTGFTEWKEKTIKEKIVNPIRYEVKKEVISNKCPECGQELAHIGGCVQCSCGFSKCN